MNNLYKIHIENILHSLSLIDREKHNKIVEEIFLCKGVIYFTGIGKNGHIAATAASTYASLGIRSIYINPVDAVHGDMGNLQKEDIVFSISKSGNTEELINFLLKVKEKEIKIFSLHSNINSKSQDISTHNIVVPDIFEADPFNIVPTVSIASYIIVLQSIGIDVANKKNFNLKQFKNNHPGGTIGFKLKNE